MKVTLEFATNVHAENAAIALETVRSIAEKAQMIYTERQLSQILKAITDALDYDPELEDPELEALLAEEDEIARNICRYCNGPRNHPNTVWNSHAAMTVSCVSSFHYS